MGLRLLSASLTAASLRIGFFKIRKVQVYQEAVVQTLAVKREDRQHILCGPFRRWRAFIVKKKTMKALSVKFRFKSQTQHCFLPWLIKSR